MTTSSAPGTGASGETGTSGGTSGTQLIREIWANRPCRFPDDGPVGGVCIGVARRYEIDPVLVRVAFGVATVLGGAGIPVYLACWLFLPAAGDAVSGGEALLGRGGASFSSGSGSRTAEPRSSGPQSSGPRSSMARRTAIVLTVLLALSAVGQIGPGKGVLFSGGVAGLVLLGAGWYLLHQRRPQAERALTVSLDKAPQPPRWDPLGAAPFAWDLPEPAQPPPPRHPRSRHTVITLGVTLIAVAAAIALRLVADWPWLSVGRIGAVALVVVGGGLVVGAFRRRGYALLAVAGPLVGFVVTAAVLGGVIGDGTGGDRTVTVTSEGQLDGHYDGGVGRTEIDLSGLTLTQNRTVTVDGGIGELTVMLPAGLPASVRCSPGIGPVDCDVSASGSGPGAGPRLTLDVDGGIGPVQVRRG